MRRIGALLLALAAAAAGAGAVRAEIIEEVAAVVNGQILTRSEVLQREAQIRAQMMQQLAGQDFEERFADARKVILTDMVRELLLLQRAEIMGLDLEKVYRSALDHLKEQQGIKTNDEMKALLKQEGITEDELRKILLRYNVPDIMINLEVRQKLVIPEDDLKAYFDEHRDEFRVEESYRLREVVLLAEGHTEEELEDLARKVQADVASGLVFAEVVLKHSEAPSRFQEGLVGPLRAPDLLAGLREVVAGLKVGEIAGPLRLRHGIHFVQLDSKTEAQEPDFDRVREGIENKLKQERFAGELDAYWERLYRENRIQVRDGYRSYAEGLPRS